jgi:pyridoxine 4-dehydrogenase
MTMKSKPTSKATKGKLPAADSGAFLIGGELPVSRLGFGAMRITGKGIWGEPKDHDEAIRVLRRTIELGINFIDTADSDPRHFRELHISKRTSLPHLSNSMRPNCRRFEF